MLNSRHLLLSIAASVGKSVINYIKTGVHDGFLIFYDPLFNITFVFEWLEYFRPKWQRYGQPGSQVNLNSDIVKTQNIQLPHMSEQNKISKFLDILNQYINLHQRKIQILGAFKKQYSQDMFTKDGQNQPNLRFNDHIGVWNNSSLGMLLDEFVDKSQNENEYEVFSSTNSGMEVRLGRVSGTSNKGYKIIDTGDLVLSPQNLWLGNININELGRGLVSPSYKTFKINDVDSEFLRPQLRTKRMLNSYKNSSTQGASVVRRNLDMKQFYKISVMIPEEKEKSHIGKFFNTLDKYLTFHKTKVEKLQLLKDSYLHKMFL